MKQLDRIEMMLITLSTRARDGDALAADTFLIPKQARQVLIKALTVWARNRAARRTQAEEKWADALIQDLRSAP